MSAPRPLKLIDRATQRKHDGDRNSEAAKNKPDNRTSESAALRRLRKERPATDFAAFVDAVAGRLEKGSAEYGGRSFDRVSVDLVGEILEELEDVAGWSFILWTRLRRVRDVLAFAEEHRAR